MRISKKTNDYYNLLTDTLKSGHLQVEKIYNRLTNLDRDKYVNIRTCYPMKYRIDSDYVFSKGKYRICWNTEAIRDEYNPIVVEKVLQKYQEWLADYALNFDNERIQELIEKELRNSIDECQEKKINSSYLDEEEEEDEDNNYFKKERNNDNYTSFNQNNFTNMKRKPSKIIEDESVSDSFYDEESNSSDNLFLCRNDEIIREDGRKKKYFRKRLGRRVKYENINEIYVTNFENSGKKFLKKSGRKISQNKDDSFLITEELENIENGNQMRLSIENNNAIKKIKILDDDDEEEAKCLQDSSCKEFNYDFDIQGILAEVLIDFHDENYNKEKNVKI